MIARQISESPCAVVLETTKGKGVSYMEGQVGWCGKYNLTYHRVGGSFAAVASAPCCPASPPMPW